MKSPSVHEEKVHDLDYTNYVSPNPEVPDQGLMAVEAVKMLAPYIKNFTLETPNSLMAPSPVPIPVPPLQTYTFIAVTGKVIARTIQHNPSEPSQQSQSVASKSGSSKSGSSKSEKPQQSQSAASSSAGPGSVAGKVEPATPKVKGKIEAGEEEDDDDAEEEVEADADEDEEGDEENELAALEALQEKSVPKAKPKGRKRKGGDTPTPQTKAAKE